ncbi:protein suppressor of white apricot [Sitodiplosis mosellana]|uniref:protein suppressor of white apricot n=1 Tax=Sitodiplosis mosellana TaxID=263140 RepID=UPI0024440DC8|nr:protein suppressor of white apricot [Sitodiplosis mosellana]
MAAKNIDDLLIFGYACKIFRDDEKAIKYDQGRHLIPWMGDNTLKIDRYDVRAALTDINQYEAPPGGYDNRLDYLSPAEQRAEQLCEEERYYSLHNNDFEEELYKEEKEKRQNVAYGQVGLNYDQLSTATAEESTKAENQNKDEQPDEVYVPHPRFYIPPNIDIPETIKVQAIIEKTAKFISEQGPQMEILIKAKQANNPLFDFLNQSGRLNAFYKHTLQAMKDGNYPTEIDRTENNLPSSDTDATTGSLYQNYYSANQTMIHIPAVKYKPSADCAYTQLISKIKGVPITTAEQAITSTPKRQNTGTIPKTNVEVKKISSGLMLAQYYNSDSEEDGYNGDSNACETDVKGCYHNEQSSKELQKNLSTIPSIGDESSIPPGVTLPPSELRVIIDKTASYVLKNGKDFEDILRAKNEQRFSFLQYKDPYHKYYTFKVTGAVSVHSNPVQDKQEHIKSVAPVSFSIKSREESTTTTLKPTINLEHSSDEESETQPSQSNSNSSPHLPNKNIQHGDDCVHYSTVDVEQSDSFLRDTMLEQQNLDEKKRAKMAEEKVKDRLALLAREKLLSKEKQLQLERRRRAMAFINQITEINGDENSGSKNTKKNDIPQSTNSEKSTTENLSDHSDSGDSVTFVSASASTSIGAAVTQTAQKHRSTRINRHSSGSDDVIEVEPKHSRSRSRSKSSSSRHHRHKAKRGKKKLKYRSRSRSRLRRYGRSDSHNYKRKHSRNRSGD